MDQGVSASEVGVLIAIEMGAAIVCYVAASALADGAGDNIPSANVSGSVNGGAFTALTGASPFAAGSSLAIFNQFIFFFNINATRTDSLNLRIDTTGLNLPAGTYTGVLHIQAQGL